MSTFQLASRRVFLPSCRRSNVVHSVARRTMMAFEDHARLRGKFEEERFSKEQEKIWVEKLKAQRALEEHLRNESHYEHVVEPVKKEFSNILAKTGDSISEEGLENLAMTRLSGP
mmetsp:Transcript_21762/g.53959  ORF Transcript_21762/g.53959 Transcript_21762/m.53959 type:complete len:115 (+) Transcript_21762:77-421(+)